MSRNPQWSFSWSWAYSRHIKCNRNTPTHPYTHTDTLMLTNNERSLCCDDRAVVDHRRWGCHGNIHFQCANMHNLCNHLRQYLLDVDMTLLEIRPMNIKYIYVFVLIKSILIFVNYFSFCGKRKNCFGFFSCIHFFLKEQFHSVCRRQSPIHYRKWQMTPVISQFDSFPCQHILKPAIHLKSGAERWWNRNEEAKQLFMANGRQKKFSNGTSENVWFQSEKENPTCASDTQPNGGTNMTQHAMAYGHDSAHLQHVMINDVCQLMY